jgi:uncharacterized protein YbgA (DUF1722 family)/uncharacterized protein YbbK (DUF523 family)
VTAIAPAGAPIRIGISSCLLGEPVRFDAGHKRFRLATDLLGEFFDWVPVCPELEAGLGVPRPSMRLVRGEAGLRVVENGSGKDHTAALQTTARKRVDRLAESGLSGYILKKDSPSCGMERVRVYDPETAMPERAARGVFAAELLDRLPDLPVEEEGRLHDPVLRENFIERVFAYTRVRALFAGGWKNGDVVRFHTAHKLQLLAHSTVLYNELGRLVAGIKDGDRARFAETYVESFMAALRHHATRGRNTNVLQHAAGHLQHLDAASRAELAELIHDYRVGLVPLVVPVTLLRHHARVGEVAYLRGQTYLEPHPKELMLRNHV